MPRFSIVIPCYNAAETLPETLASLRAQSFADWEAICIDDGSTDATAAVIEAAAAHDPRIRREASLGKGPSDARNEGALLHASGEIVAFLDADDLWWSEKLAVLDLAFTDETVDACYGRIAFFDKQPHTARVFSTVVPGPLGVADLLGENPVCTMSNVAVRRDVFAASGGFDRDMVHNEDLEWLIRLTGSGAKLIGLPQMMVWYRASPTGLSSDLEAMRKGREAALASARKLGFTPSPADEAVHLRYLARRALRLQGPRMTALRLTATALRTSPAGFFADRRRGAFTAAAAILNPLLPRRLSGALFAR
ncbi:glycosyltransferase family 2 protein [Halovulum sp. GXIMD14794]